MRAAVGKYPSGEGDVAADVLMAAERLAVAAVVASFYWFLGSGPKGCSRFLSSIH